MGELKKYGFTIGVVAMVILLLAFSYLYVMSQSSLYAEKETALSKVERDLKRYADMPPDMLPTAALLKVRAAEKEELDAAVTDGDEFYANAVSRLQELRFKPGGVVHNRGDAAGMSNAYSDAMTELNQRYRPEKERYVKEVFTEKQLSKIAAEELKFADVDIQPQATFETPDDLVESAERCRITRGIFEAAMDAKWGGMSAIAFEKRKRSEVKKSGPPPAKEKAAEAKRKGKPAPKRGAKAKEEPKEVKPIDPQELYEKVKVTVVGEMRFCDLGPFLNRVYQRAQHETDPVLFVVEEVCLTNQIDRLPRPLYESAEPYESEVEARSAPLDKEVKVPTATLRLILSAFRWKGFPAEGGA